MSSVGSVDAMSADITTAQAISFDNLVGTGEQ
jgi:hypothetical protein